MILLQLFGIACGLCIVVGVPWAIYDNIKTCGFEPSVLIIMPLAGCLTLLGGFVVVVSASFMFAN